MRTYTLEVHQRRTLSIDIDADSPAEAEQMMWDKADDDFTIIDTDTTVESIQDDQHVTYSWSNYSSKWQPRSK